MKLRFVCAFVVLTIKCGRKLGKLFGRKTIENEKYVFTTFGTFYFIVVNT